MDVSNDTRRNSFTSQQNVANDITADICVAADVPNEFVTFATDISLTKGVTVVSDSLTPPPLVMRDKRVGCHSNKRSYSVDAIKFQYPQHQTTLHYLHKDNGTVQDSTTSIASSSSAAATPVISSASSAIVQQPRQRSQSAQYWGAINVAEKSSLDHMKHEEKEEDLREEEDTTIIDSMIAEYNYPLEDFNNNNNSSDSNNQHHHAGNDDDTNYHDFMLDIDYKDIVAEDADGEDTEDITQASSFDDDCYVFDNQCSIRNE